MNCNSLIDGPPMYDNIKLILDNPFDTPAGRDKFTARFGLFVKDEKKGILHNKGYETLEQNHGLFMTLQLPTDRRKETLSVCFSLHKFYNSMTGKGYINYNDFTFEDAGRAFHLLTGLLGIGIGRAVVRKYETGINVITGHSPDEYMKELDFMEIRGKKLRILEDVNQKEYKQYCTNRNKDRRIVYIFYNKTFEARSKIKGPGGSQTEIRRANIPGNIMRIEQDNKNPISKIRFSDLFDPLIQQQIKHEFKERFIADLHYRVIVLASSGITGKQKEVWKMIREVGEDGVTEHYRQCYKTGSISVDQYKYFRKIIREMSGHNLNIRNDISELAKELSLLITNKLSRV